VTVVRLRGRNRYQHRDRHSCRSSIPISIPIPTPTRFRVCGSFSPEWSGTAGGGT